jgi:hypothetical protein
MSLIENKDQQSSKKLSDIELIRGFELIKQGAEAKIYIGTFEAKKVVAKMRLSY